VHLHLSLQARRQLFLIYKECIHNVARHSGCTRAVAELCVEDREVVLSIQDNGRGLNRPDPPRTGDGSGIPSMTLRAENVGGSVQLLSNPGQGCTVVVRIPI
jgi:signal transduction histidine kinase